MFRENKEHLQEKLFTSIYLMDKKVRKRLMNGWAPLYYEHVFSNIDETIFSPLYNEKKLTYRELDMLSDKISIFLEKELGNKVGKEAIVAVYMNKSNLYVATTLAILKLQCAFLPLDIKLPLKRKEHIINDWETEILLTDNSATNLNFGSCTRLRNKINLQEQLDKIEYETGKLKKRKISPENLAYVIYTSGSTGMPKGTLIEHKGLVNLKELWQKKFGVSSKDSNNLGIYSIGVT
ncbi:AMP-binding protein [Clostridium sp.]|uniref:AMP-binding protein n=1 Tax=Clostridium sp. TaxID=1506 RepID=UPI0035A151F0